MPSSEPFFNDHNTLERRWLEIDQILEYRWSDIVLDIGCAEGLISEYLSKKVTQVIAFDVDGQKIEKAKKFQTNPATIYFREDVLKYIKRPKHQYFEAHITLCLGVLHKLPSLEEKLDVIQHCLMNTIRTVVFRFPHNKDLELFILKYASKCKFLTYIQPSKYEDQGNILICRKFAPPI